MSAVRLRNPSLEFNWLPNSLRKGIATPRVYLVDDDRWGGVYWRREPERTILRTLGLDLDLAEGGLILLCAAQTVGALTHEYRHHWQLESGYKFGESVWSQKPGESYRDSIVRYFRAYWWEADAQRFQNKMAPDDASLQWAEWLREPAAFVVPGELSKC